MSVATAMMEDVTLPESPIVVRPIVGRRRELAELNEMLGLRAGAPATHRGVLVAGDAGVGKTRLLTELRDVAVGEGWCVLAGHCLDFGDSALPYLPFSEVVGRLALDVPDLLEETTGRRPVLAALQPGRRTMQGAEQDVSAAVDRGELFDAVHDLFEKVAEAQPLLLVVEDLHWADTSTRDLVSFLLSRRFTTPVAVVASYRSDDLHRRHPLRRAVAEWVRNPAIARLDVDPMPERDVRSLVGQLHPGPLRESDVAGIVTRAEGNAFFVEELVGAASFPSGVPDDLADLLLVRLDRLDDPTQQVVRAASVSGRRVSHDLLVDLFADGVDGTDLDTALRGAIEHNVLVASSNAVYRFRHALLAEAVYDDLLPGERARLHAAYVEALVSGRVAGTAAELARHARAAHDLPRAVDASIRAGDEAMSVGGPDEAVDHFLTALDLLQDAAVRDEVEVDLGLLGQRAADALVASGRPGRAISVVRDLIGGLPDDWPTTERARLLVALANAVMVEETRLDPLEFTRQALEMVPDERTPLRATVLAAHSRALAFARDADTAREIGAEALTLAESQDMPRLATDVVTTLASLGTRDAEDVRDDLAEAVRRARDTGARNAEVRSLFLLGRWHQDRAHFADAAEHFAAAAARAAEAGQPWAPYGFDARLMRAQVAVITGDLDAAWRIADVSGQSPPAVAETLLAGIDLMVHAIRGEADKLAVVPELRRHWRKDGLVPITVGPAVIELLASGRDVAAILAEHDAVVEAMTALWREFFHARVRLAAVTLGALAGCAPTLSAAERQELSDEIVRVVDGARRTLALQAEEASHWGPEGVAWAARLTAEHLRLRWLLGIDPPEERDLVEAWRVTVDRFTDYGHVWEIARSRARLAAILRSVGETAESRAIAESARSAAAGLGAAPLLDEIRTLAGPARASASADDTRTSLTARESEILALVAEGRTNGEIGKQLFISTKTVSVHVSNILAKLGAAGRTEAAAIARRTGLL